METGSAAHAVGPFFRLETRVMTNQQPALASVVIAAAWWPLSVAGEQRAGGGDTRKPQAEIVHTVGCVERGAGDTWRLTRAAEPETTRPGVFETAQVDDARQTEPGSHEFRLIGVADFLTAEGLLRYGNRALFTTPEQINASGELREGRTVLVKGLLIDPDGEPRINLLAVVGLADTCN